MSREDTVLAEAFIRRLMRQYWLTASAAMARRCRDLGAIRSESCTPGPFFHMPLDILHQIAEAFPFDDSVCICLDIAEDPLNRVGTRTVVGTRATSSVDHWRPLVDGFRFMNTVVIHDHIDTRISPLGTCGPAGPGVPEISHCFYEGRDNTALYQSPDSAPASSVFVGARRHDLVLRALRASRLRRPSAGVDIEFIRRHHDFMPSSFVPNRIGPSVRSGVDHHLWPPAWHVSRPSRSHGASGARFCGHRDPMLWPGASWRAWHSSTGCGTSHRPVGLF